MYEGYYKNEKDWEDISLDELAYRAELQDEEEAGYTKQQLIDECNGNPYTAECMFNMLSWQHPSTLLDEWLIEGEIDEEYNLLNN